MADVEKVVKALEEVIAEAVYPDRPRKFMMPLELAEDALALLKAQKPRGEWKELKVDCMVNRIDEWQSAKCSVCGKYHTTPYLYYFNNYNYCPNCGAKMDGERRDSE